VRHRSLGPALLLAAALLHGTPLDAQSIIWGTVSGRVTTTAGQRVPRAFVTLTALGGGQGDLTTTDLTGAFEFPLVAAGSYEVRVEALGYRPIVARTLTILGGERRTVSLSIAEAPPPVLSVDTVGVDAGGWGRWKPGGMYVGSLDFDAVPHRFDEAGSIAAMSSDADGSFGSQGLPGSATMVYVDGVPFYRAAHPVARAEATADALFPRAALSGLTAFHGTPDIEWTGSSGGYLALQTRSAAGSGSLELEGSGSAAPLWSSAKHDFSTPSLTSFRAALRGTIAVSPEASRLFVGAEAMQEDTPLVPRVGETLATALTGLDQDLLNALSTPSTERFSRYSALLRGDSRTGERSRLFYRGAAAYSKREFEGPGPLTLGREAALPEESVDFSLAGGAMWEHSATLDFELRGGVSGSRREFDTLAPGTSAFLTADGAVLGAPYAGAGESKRTDVVLLPVAHWERAGGVVKLGGRVRFSLLTMSTVGPEEFAYSDAAALLAGRGFAQAVSSESVSYSTKEFGLFAQYAFEPGPGLRASVGGRYDHERIPGSSAAQNAQWLAASGLPNDSFPSTFDQWSAHATFAWDATSDGRTRILGTMSMHNGDVDTRAITQILSQDVGATSTRYAGTGLTWPGGSIPGAASTLPTLAMLGPDTRAPRTVQGSFAAVRQLAGAFSLYVEGSYRRTDFLMRRRNLNVPASARAADDGGRAIFGTLQQDGELVTATGADARRFPGLGEVWGLDPDGWSEYRGATGGFEYSGDRIRLFAAYTLSETEDNWVGAARGSGEGELEPLLPAGATDWTHGTSDFDVRHRVAATAAVSLGFATLSTFYRFRSGLPFTPRYRDGVDANGDGSFLNDVAFVDAALVDPILGDWPCLSDQVGSFARRNSCRGPVEHSVDVRLSVELGRVAGREARLMLDAFNLVESDGGILDEALVRVDPAGSIVTSPDGSTVTIPVVLNPDFGSVLYRLSRGRMLRIGLRIG